MKVEGFQGALQLGLQDYERRIAVVFFFKLDVPEVFSRSVNTGWILIKGLISVPKNEFSSYSYLLLLPYTTLTVIIRSLLIFTYPNNGC